MPGIKISDLTVASVIAGDIVITQRGTSNYGGTIGNQITAIESLIEAFQSDTSTAALSIKVDQNNLYTNSTASLLFDNNNGTTVGRILWDETASTFNLGYGANNHLTIDSTGAVTIAGNTVWTAGNDGPTSGLDADLLDGQHGSYYGTATDVAANTAKDLSIYSTSVNSYRTVSTVNGAVASAGWVTVATNTTGRKHGEVIVSDSESGDHAFIRIDWMRSFADSNYSVLQVGGHQNRITGVRVLSQDSDNTYGVKLLQVYVTVGSIYGVRINTLGSPRGYVSHSAVTPVIENTKSGYTVHGNALTNLDLVTLAAEEGIKTGGVVYASGGDSTNWNTAYTKTAILDYDATLFNLSLGDGALAAALLTGTNNIATGYQSLYSNTTGSHNIATGYNALFSNTTGNYNSAMGFYALFYNTTGGYNVASGYQAGRYQADGTTALTVANDSIFIGKDTRGVNAATNQIVIGDSAIGLGSNTTVIGSAATTLNRLFGKLALGKDIASSRLHVYEDNASSSSANGITIEQDGTGDALLQFLLTGAQRWAVGVDNSAADSFVISPSPLDGANGLTIDTSGNVGIGTVIPTHDLEIETTKINSTRFKNVTPTGALVSRFHNSADDGLSLTVYGPTYAAGSVGGVGPGGAAVVNTGGALAIGTRDAGDVHLLSNDTTRMTIVSGGNVGIGTTTPTVPLHVTLGAEGGVAASGEIAMFQNGGTTTDNADITLLSGNIGRSRINLGDTGDRDAGYINFDHTTDNLHFGHVGTQDDLTIDSSGNVGIGTTTPGAELDIAGGIITTSGVATTGNRLRLTNPGGGSTGVNFAFRVGAIKVTLPESWTSTMLRMTIKVYDYATNESFTVVCGGYTYSPGTTWINHFAYIESAASKDTNFTVRFGHDGTKCCIYIGELNSVWSYPQVYVTEVEAGYNSYTAADWQDGWAVGFEASAFGAVTKTQTDTQINNWSRSGQDVHFSSGTGNVGIGTTTPNAGAALDVSSTTKAFLPPRMTTTQKNAIASPAAGMVVYDTTLSKLAVYTGSAWETITSA